MKRKPYPSDLTDAQWAILVPLIPVAKSGGRPQQVNVREVINAIFYILCGGCTWRMMPHEFPAWKTVYHYFRFWRLSGVWQQMNQTLRERVRCRTRRESTPSAAIVDSQSVKTTEVAQEVGYDGGRLVKGHKRHIIVDTLGLLLQAIVSAANVSEKAGAKLLWEKSEGQCPRKTEDFCGWWLRRSRFYRYCQTGLSVRLGSGPPQVRRGIQSLALAMDSRKNSGAC